MTWVCPDRLDRKTDPHVRWTRLVHETSLTQHLRVIAAIRPAPGLPYITSRIENTTPLFTAITRALEALSARDRARL